MAKAASLSIYMLLLLGATIIYDGCGNSKARDPGLLQENGIADAGHLACAVIKMVEGGGDYIITDKAVLEKTYALLNDAKRGSGGSKYIRPNMVTLVRKSGRTFSMAFGLYNPTLTDHYSSRAFVEFVKTDILGNAKYMNQQRLPSLTIRQAARIEGTSKRKVLADGQARRLQQSAALLTSAYRPFGSRTTADNWAAITSLFTSGRPGYEIMLSTPMCFRTLVGSTEPEPANGSDALVALDLTVDKLVFFQDANRRPSLAFRSGGSWFVTSAFDPKDLQGQTPESIYNGLLGL